MASFLIAASLVVLAIGSYVVWPSRWNVPAHLQLGFSLVAYIIPVCVGATGGFSPQLVAFDAEVLAVGAVTYVLGILIGYNAPILPFWEAKMASRWLSQSSFLRFVRRRANRMALIGLVGLFACFALMGFVPAFAANPFMAKFFRGIYQVSYRRVAIPYRLCFYLVLTLIPVLFTVWYQLRSRLAFLLAASATVGIALTLDRGPIAMGALLALGLWAAHKKRWFLPYLLLVAVAFPIGAGLYKLIGLNNYPGYNLFQIVAAGSPDIHDQLVFLNRFLVAPVFTHGRTFWGGLIPWHYRWNPSVFTLTVITRTTNINGIESGGLRLVAPQWGYVAFGWLGVALVPLLSGFVWGYATRLVRRNLNRGDLVQAIVLLVLYTTLWLQLSQFYTLTVYELPQIAVAILLAYPIALSRRDVAREPVSLAASMGSVRGVAGGQVRC